VTTYSYNSLGLPSQVTPPSPLGAQSMTYNSYDLPAGTTDGNNQSTGRSYDALGNLTAASYADGSSVTDAYDSNGNRTSETEIRTSTWQLVQNGGFEASATNPPPNWQMTGPAGDGTGVSSFKQHTGSHSYHFYVYGFNTHELWQTVTLPSSFSQVTLSYWLYQATLSKTGSTCPAWYVKIRTASGTDITTIANPCPTNFTTNTWMQQSLDLTSVLASYAGQQVEVYFKTYAGTVNQYVYYLDDVTLGASPGTTTTTYTYNALNQQTSMSVSTGQNVSYTYDGMGNLLTKTDAGGTLTDTYTALDQVQSVKDPSGATTTFGYDADGQRSQIAYPNGVTETMGYNLAGQLTSIGAVHGSTTLTSFTYTYTNPSSGQPQSMPNAVTDTSGDTTTYTYDQLNRLTQALQKTSGGTQLHNYQYGFDPASNMTSLTRDSTTITKTFNAANEMTQANTTTYSYDGNGQRTGDSSGTSTQYNTARQTTSITPAGGQTVTMAYAAQAGGAQTVDGGVLYQYDALGSSSAVQNGVTTYFTRASDGTLVSQRPSSGGTYYYLTDGEGSVVALTDSSGTMVDQYTFEPTGKAVISNGSVWNPYQWHQAQWDPAVGQYEGQQAGPGAQLYDPTTAEVLNRPRKASLPPDTVWHMQFGEYVMYLQAVHREDTPDAHFNIIIAGVYSGKKFYNFHVDLAGYNQFSGEYSLQVVGLYLEPNGRYERVVDPNKETVCPGNQDSYFQAAADIASWIESETGIPGTAWALLKPIDNGPGILELMLLQLAGVTLRTVVPIQCG
jgi:YD repeat-containing protein